MHRVLDDVKRDGRASWSPRHTGAGNRRRLRGIHSRRNLLPLPILMHATDTWASRGADTTPARRPARSPDRQRRPSSGRRIMTSRSRRCARRSRLAASMTSAARTATWTTAGASAGATERRRMKFGEALVFPHQRRRVSPVVTLLWKRRLASDTGASGTGGRARASGRGRARKHVRRSAAGRGGSGVGRRR